MSSPTPMTVLPIWSRILLRGIVSRPMAASYAASVANSNRIVIFNAFINDSHTSFVHPVHEHPILLRRSQQGAVRVPPLFAREWRPKRGRVVNRILSSRELRIAWHPLFVPWPLI